MTAASALMPESFTEVWSALTMVRSRLSFRFSATGCSAAALVADGRGFLFCEYWDLTGTGTCRAVPGFRIAAPADGAYTVPPFDAVPFDDGSVLVIGPNAIEIVAPSGAVSPAGKLPFRPSVITAAPDGSRSVVFIGQVDSHAWAVWTWNDAAGLAGPVCELPALNPRGGGWLDMTAHRYVLNVASPGRAGATSPMILNMSTGVLSDLPIHPRSDYDIAWHTAPRVGEVLLASHRGEHCELRLHGPDGIRTLDAPLRLDGVVTPVAMRPSGGSVLLNESDGLRQRLAVLDTDRDIVHRMPDFLDHAIGAATWAETAVWALMVGPGTPARMMTATVEAADRASTWRELTDDSGVSDGVVWAPGWLERLPGGDGDIEAIVCGHADWRTARHVVLALHGGPADQWTLKFSQLFQVFAAHGITVIAPNPRGSTGYGDAFHETIIGAWGGPDLADVLALARHVRSQRGVDQPLALYGASYGAFLALLATAAVPDLWTRTLAVAPMLNAHRLYPQSTASVRAMIDRLGGLTVLSDTYGSRDLLSVARRLTTPVALIHGQDDPVIPASQSRQLVAELERLGRRSGDDFHYLEVGGAGHSPFDGSAELHQSAARYLTCGDWPTSSTSAQN